MLNSRPEDCLTGGAMCGFSKKLKELEKETHHYKQESSQGLTNPGSLQEFHQQSHMFSNVQHLCFNLTMLC